AAACGGGGGGGGGQTPPDETAPDAPTINAVAGDNLVDANEAAAVVVVSGTAEAGSTVVVTWGDVVSETTAADDGSWSVTFDPGELPADGPSTIKATATDAAGNTSAEATLDVTVDTVTPVVDTTPPDAPVLNAVGTVNAAAVAAGVTVSGTAEPNSTVDV